jgi:hypothetical protein
MDIKGLTSNIAALVALGVVGFAPISGSANTYKHHSHSRHRAATHRQHTKNAWRNAAYGAGALGVLGLVTHNGTLATLGLGGAAYSASRYEHDRKSQKRIQHGH